MYSPLTIISPTYTTIMDWIWSQGSICASSYFYTVYVQPFCRRRSCLDRLQKMLGPVIPDTASLLGLRLLPPTRQSCESKLRRKRPLQKNVLLNLETKSYAWYRRQPNVTPNVSNCHFEPHYPYPWARSLCSRNVVPMRPILWLSETYPRLPTNQSATYISIHPVRLPLSLRLLTCRF